MASVVGMREHVLMLCGLNLISCREEYVPLIGSRCGRDVGASRTWVSKDSSSAWLRISIF